MCSIGYKIYATWLVRKLREYAGDPGHHQTAFTRDWSVDDPAFYARRCLETQWNTGNTMVIASLDLKQAFDCVNIATVSQILKDLNVPDHIINRVCQAINAEQTRVLWEGISTEPKRKGKGIKQGCPMSPYIFNLIIQKVIKSVKRKFPKLNLLETGSDRLPVILAFADDLLIIARTAKDLETIIHWLKEELLKVGLELNTKKSNIMIREPMTNRNIPDSIVLDGEVFQVVKIMKYLGTYMTETLDRPQTTRKRCRQAINSSKIMVEYLRRYKPPWSLAKLMYKTVISPTMTFGLKTAAMIQRNRKSVARYELQILKEMLKYCKDRPRGRISVSRLLDGKSAIKKTRVMRINYWGHIQRRPEGHPLKVALNMEPIRRKRGRPAKTWLDSLKEDKAKLPEVSEQEWINLAKDKDKIKKKAEEIYKIIASEEESESDIED